jgi:predicted small integral membrane protein
MDKLIIIVASISFSYYFIHIAGIPFWIKRKLNFKRFQRLKPLDCLTCLSVWVAVILFFMPTIAPEFIATIFLSGIIANNIK